MTQYAVGELVRDWRVRRRRSQMDTALSIGVSPRHLSFVETGRSRPSAELLVALGEGLDVPLRERNVMLLAAGYAPRYRETPLDGAAMAQVRASLQRLLDAHDPYPGVVIDRLWNVVMANKAAGAMVAGLPADVAGPPTNVFRACLHPNGLAARTLNFEEWAAYLLDQLHRLVALTADPAAQRLLDEVMRYPNIGALRRDCAPVATAPMLLVPLQLDTDARRGAMLSLYTTLTTFGTPLDVTLSELSVELFYPSDDESERMLRAAAGS